MVLFHDRDYFTGGLELREGTADHSPQLVGYAAVFNQETRIRMGPQEEWREMIAPTAFNSAIGRDDVIAAVNHDHTKLLGRTKSGTLRLTADAHGLRYEVDLPNTQLAAEVREQVRRGDLRGSSFKFGIPEGGARIVKGSARHASGLPLVVIEDVRLLDVGPVTFPAYDGTSVTARAMPIGLDVFIREWRAEEARDHDVTVRERQRLRLAVAQAWAS